jgi:hypothetical protein
MGKDAENANGTPERVTVSRPLEPVPEALAPLAATPLVQPQAERERVAGRVHLVVVRSRALEEAEVAGTDHLLRTRFWHPRDQRWSENDFESLEHALRLFVDESGWVLRQDQGLDGSLAREWVFEAHRADFTGATQEEILTDFGLTPEGVERLLEELPPPPP